MVLSICEYLGGINESKSKRLIFHSISGASRNLTLQSTFRYLLASTSLTGTRERFDQYSKPVLIRSTHCT